MQAYTSKETCELKPVSVIPSGLTAYLQAKDIGNYSSFKEKLSSLIDAWKGSDQVDYMRGGNRRPSAINAVSSWVALAWKNVPGTVVQKFVAAVGFFIESAQWHIARHDDLFGDLFRMKWIDREPHDCDQAQMD